MSRTKADVEDDKPARFCGWILFPIWTPIKFAGALVGMLFELLRGGFCEGRDFVKMFSDAWRGPDKEEQ